MTNVSTAVEIVRLEGPATVIGFDVEVLEREVVRTWLEHANGSVLIEQAAFGPHSLAMPPFDDDSRPLVHLPPDSWLHVSQGEWVVLKSDHAISGTILTTRN